jgi:hypothetical protein
MYNLNYNVTNCRLNRPTGKPFVPSWRQDPYSASLVLAIPGAIFKNGYVNVFNQITPYDDISAYIKSGSQYNELTSQYYPVSGNHQIETTGSLGIYTASYSVNNFVNQGYESSIMFSGSIGLKVSKDFGLGNGTNLSVTKSFVIEGWAAFDVTSSFVSKSSGTGDPRLPVAVGERIFAQQYRAGDLFSGSYYSVINNISSPQESVPLKSGSMLFVDNYNSGETIIYPQSSSLGVPKQFRHFAYSYTATNSSLKMYIDGAIVGQGQLTNEFDYNPQLFLQLFGDEGESYVNAASASQLPAGYFQDFRMYNGTNKNYTASLIPVPESMIIGYKEPYPVPAP